MEDQKKAVYSLVQGEEGEAWARRMFSGWNMTSKGKSMPWIVICSLASTQPKILAYKERRHGLPLTLLLPSTSLLMERNIV